MREVNPGIESYYIFDYEGFPCGVKSEKDLIVRVNHILELAQQRLVPEVLVGACNTASNVGLPSLREHLTTPVVGVVPAIRPACLRSRKKIVALLAADGTVSRDYTRKLIDKYANGCKVLLPGTMALSRIVEEKLSDGKVVLDEAALDEIKQVLQPLSSSGESEHPDVVVPGCTHYPFIREVLQQLLPDMSLFDSGEAAGRRGVDILSGIREPQGREHTPDRDFYTGGPLNFEERLRLVKSMGYQTLERFPL